jgi:DNA-binding transcriptional ArsR family regulator
MAPLCETVLDFVPLKDRLYNLTTGVNALLGRLQRNGIGSFLDKELRELPSAPLPQRRLTPPQIEQLVLDYKAGVGSIYVLARNYGVDRGTISQHLRAAGLKLGRLPLTDAEVERAAKLRADGHSFNAIGRSLKRDPKTIKKALV